MQKALLICTSSYPSSSDDAAAAAGLFVRDFALNVAAEGIAVTVLTQRKRESIVEEEGICVRVYPWLKGAWPVSNLNLHRPTDMLLAYSLLRQGGKQLRSLVHTSPFSRCLCMWALPAGYMAMKALQGTAIPYDVWCLGSDIWNYGRRRSSRWLVRQVLRRADHLFADGLGLAQEVTALSGRNCDFLPSSRRLPETTPVIPRLIPGKPNFLFIGRWHPNKGVDLLPEAMRLVRERGQDVHLHLFGGGPLENTLKSLIAQHRVADYITVHGYANPDTAAAYLRACDWLIIPSRIESIPIIFSDAMQGGIPVIATEVGDLGELVRKYGVGQVVPSSSTAALAEAIGRAAREPRCHYQQGTSQAAADFDPRRAVAQYLQKVGLDPLPAQQPRPKTDSA